MDNCMMQKCTKLYVMGKSGCGKTTLVRLLLNESMSPPVVTSSPTSTSSTSSLTSTSPLVSVLRWDLKTGIENQGKQNNFTSIEVWDFPGNELYKEALSPCLVSPGLFLVLAEADSSYTDLIETLSHINNKCPGSQVVIALTQGDRLTNCDNKEVTKRSESVTNMIQDWLYQRKLSVKRHIDGIKSELKIVKEKCQNGFGKIDGRTSLSELLESLRQTMGKSLVLHNTVFVVSAITGMGISLLRQTILEKATSSVLFPCIMDGIVSDASMSIVAQQCVVELKELGDCLVPWKQISEIFKKRFADRLPRETTQVNGVLEILIKELAHAGTILDIHLPLEKKFTFNSTVTSSDICDNETTCQYRHSWAKEFHPSPTPKDMWRFICVNPEAFANMICNCLMTDDRKVFRLEASRFWPKDSGFKPADPHLLARVLAMIPTKGIIREAVFPIIWQELELCQTQIQHALVVLEALGILTPSRPMKTDCAGLAMPTYSALSPVACYHSVLMDLMPENKPQLNWSLKPFQGDLQVTWRLRGATKISVSGLKKVFATVRWTFHRSCDFSHIWSQGLLLKFSNATVCLEISANVLDISCRVNGDDPGQEDIYVQLLWVYLVPVIEMVDDFFTHQMPGVLLKTSLILYGDVFYMGDRIAVEPEISLFKLLLSKQMDGYLTIEDDHIDRKINLDLLFPFHCEESKHIWTPEDWKELVMQKQESVLKLFPAHPYTAQKANHNKLTVRKSVQRRRRAEVKWSTVISEEVKVPVSVDVIQVVTNGVAEDAEQIVVPEDTCQSQNKIETKKQEIQDVNGSVSSQPTPSLEGTELRQPDTTLIAQGTSPRSASHDKDWMREATSLASKFVAAMMASGVAKYVATCSEFGPAGVNIVTTAEMTAARVTAEAALAVHNGDLDGAARAVIEAVKAVQAREKMSNDKRRASTSRLCIVL